MQGNLPSLAFSIHPSSILANLLNPRPTKDDHEEQQEYEQEYNVEN
jgi:hypothetical protein